MKRIFFTVLIILFLLCPFVTLARPSGPIHLDEAKFKVWLENFKNDAAREGISKETIDSALADIKPIPRIIELDRKQPEFTKTFQQYIESVVPQARIKRANEELAKNRQLLEEISKKYGVQKRFIVALWGIETDFGTKTGSYYIPEALATLAFEGRRHEFFRKELINALKIIDQDHIKHSDMKGSWAGAMGQTQFMPSSFLSYSQDYNGDGKRDIWNTRADVFASIANYLRQVGWDGNATWGKKVKLPEGFDKSFIKKDKKLSEWQALGVRNINGNDLPAHDMVAMLSMPGGKDGDAFLVYNNYKNILKWNRSDYFATAVGKLSDSIEE